jgi:hypothetical protein
MNGSRFGIAFAAPALALVLGLARGAPAAEPARPTVSSLERRVTEWGELRARIAAERRDWAERKEHGLAETRLLEAERAACRREIAEWEAASTEARKTEAAVLEKKENLERALEAVKPALDRAEAALRRWQARLPPSLAEPLRGAFADLPDTSERAAALGVVPRLQAVLALYAELESLQNAVHVRREVLTWDGAGRREMDVLYLGLAAGYAVAADGAAVALGQPGEGGWTWRAAPPAAVVADAVRRAIAIHRREAPAALAPLPLPPPARRAGADGKAGTP